MYIVYNTIKCRLVRIDTCTEIHHRITVEFCVVCKIYKPDENGKKKNIKLISAFYVRVNVK